MKLIEIVVAPTGEARVQTKGFVGSECRQSSEFLERALGSRVSEALTAEFHQTQSTQQQVTEGGAA
jgi:hypothetical protein